MEEEEEGDWEGWVWDLEMGRTGEGAAGGEESWDLRRGGRVEGRER